MGTGSGSPFFEEPWRQADDTPRNVYRKDRPSNVPYSEEPWRQADDTPRNVYRDHRSGWDYGGYGETEPGYNTCDTPTPFWNRQTQGPLIPPDELPYGAQAADDSEAKKSSPVEYTRTVREAKIPNVGDRVKGTNEVYTSVTPLPAGSGVDFEFTSEPIQQGGGAGTTEGNAESAAQPASQPAEPATAEKKQEAATAEKKQEAVTTKTNDRVPSERTGRRSETRELDHGGLDSPKEPGKSTEPSPSSENATRASEDRGAPARRTGLLRGSSDTPFGGARPGRRAPDTPPFDRAPRRERLGNSSTGEQLLDALGLTRSQLTNGLADAGRGVGDLLMGTTDALLTSPTANPIGPRFGQRTAYDIGTVVGSTAGLIADFLGMVGGGGMFLGGTAFSVTGSQFATATAMGGLAIMGLAAADATRRSSRLGDAKQHFLSEGTSDGPLGNNGAKKPQTNTLTGPTDDVPAGPATKKPKTGSKPPAHHLAMVAIFGFNRFVKRLPKRQHDEIHRMIRRELQESGHWVDPMSFDDWYEHFKDGELTVQEMIDIFKQVYREFDERHGTELLRAFEKVLGRLKDEGHVVPGGGHLP